MAVNRWNRASAGVGVLHGSAARVLIQRSIGVAGRTRGFRGDKCSQNDEDEDCDQHYVPAPESCGGARSGRSQTALKRAIITSVYSEFPFVRHSFHKPPSTAATQILSEAAYLIKMYRITIWLQDRNRAPGDWTV